METKAYKQFGSLSKPKVIYKDGIDYIDYSNNSFIHFTNSLKQFASGAMRDSYMVNIKGFLS